MPLSDDRGRRKATKVKTEARKSPSRSKTADWQIVVVDDEEQCANLFARILRDEGYAVRTAYSGTEALKLLRELPADLVLADMVMPQMNGMQLLAHIKELYPETDVIVLTGFGTIEDSLEAMRRGAADFLPKPFQPRELSRLTSSCLRAKRANGNQAFMKQSQSMLELARLLSQTSDAHVLPARALELARDNFDADAAILLTYEPAQETLSVLAHTGAGLSRWGHSQQLAAQGLEAIRQQATILAAEPENGDCYAYAPLLVADRPRGVLCLRRAGGPWFHEKSSELLEVFATHLALALESAQLYETASQQVSDLEELITLSRSLALKTHPDEISHQILIGAQRLTRAEICAVLLTVEGRTLFRTVPLLPEGSLLYEAVRARLQAALATHNNTSAQSDRSNSGISLSTPDLAVPSETGQSLPSHVRQKLASFVNTPLVADEDRFGILGVFSSKPNYFAVNDVRCLSALADNAVAAMENSATLARVSNMYHESIELLSSSVEARDVFCAGHSNQVRIFAGELARAISLDVAEVYRIEDGALLHDIGKICIPRSILSKPDPLTDREYDIVTTHPVYGANMFRNTTYLSNLVPIIRHHHEHFNGTGYPDGLRGKEIPLGARIVALGDVFDALISHRPYRPTIDIEQARRMIELKGGSQFDPELTRVFLSLPLADLIQH